MNRLSKLFKDPSGYVFYILNGLTLKFRSYISTRATYFLCFLKGIRLGKRVRFYGMPILKRHFESDISLGDNCRFRSDPASNLVGLNRKNTIATFRSNAKLSIGNNSGFSGTVIGCAKNIKIGNDVLCGGNTFITDFDWHPINRKKANEPVLSAPVVIKDNVWLGLNVIVLKGVTIGENSIIGANSVVTSDIPSNVIAVGNPCRVVKNMQNE